MNALQSLREEFDDVRVLIGSADRSGEQKNPLDLSTRKQIIQNCTDVQVKGIEDESKDEEGNRKWVSKLEDNVGEAVLVSGNELVQRLVEEYTEIRLREPDYSDPEVYSGTEIRRRIRSGEEWRYLVPECSAEILEEHLEEVEESGIEYEFEPGWKKENAFYGTADK